MLRNYFFIIFLVLCIFIGENPCNSKLIVQDVTPSYYARYSKYAAATTGKCSYTFYLLNTNDDGTGTGTGTLTASSGTATATSSNATSTFFTLSLTGISAGSSSVSLTTSDANVYYINVTCTNFINQAGLVTLIDKTYPSGSGSSRVGYIKVDGLDSSIYFDTTVFNFTCVGYSCTIAQVGHSNVFSLVITYSPATTATITTQLKLISYNYTTTVTTTLLNTLFSTGVDLVTTANFYPPDPYNTQVILNSYSAKPLFTFTVNNTLDNRVFPITYASSLSSNGYYPISGTLSTTTYLSYFTNGVGSGAVSIYSLSTTSFASRITSSTYTVTQVFTPSSIPSTSSDSSFNTDTTTPVVSVEFKSTTQYDHLYMTLWLEKLVSTAQLSAPFGFSYGNNLNYTYRASTLISPDYTNYLYPNFAIRYQPSGSVTTSWTATDTDKRYLNPVIQSLEVDHITDNYFIMRLGIQANNGVRDYASNLVSGTVYDGTFELLVDSLASFASPFYIYDNLNNFTSLTIDTLVTINPVTFFATDRYVNQNNKFDIFDLSNFEFEKNNLDVTNQTIYNTLRFNYTTASRDTSFFLYFYGDAVVEMASFQVPAQRNGFSSIYNESIGLFQIDFIVPPNPQQSANGIPFNLLVDGAFKISNYALPASYQLIVTTSTMDLYGPVFKTIQKYPSDGYVITSGCQAIGWKVEIEDDYNGFSSGVVTVKSSLDNAVFQYSFTLTNSGGGDQYLGQYDILFELCLPCFSQQLIITDVTLLDNQGMNSTWSLTDNTNPASAILNPFINYLNDSTINRISYVCTSTSQNTDTTPPDLVSWQVSKSTFDFGSINRAITVTFSAQDIESGLRTDVNPIIYFQDSKGGMVSCPTNLTSYTGTLGSYNCTTTLPVGFGYPYGLILSVYGIINNNGLYRGYSADQLHNLTYVHFLSAGSTYTINQPVITSSKRLSTNQNTLWIFGRGFQETTQVQLSYLDDGKGFVHLLTPNPGFFSSALSVTLTRKSAQPFYIKLVTSSNLVSNVFLITPYYYPFIADAIGSSSETTPSTEASSSISASTSIEVSSSESYETISPIPTNSPQTCKSNCGGSARGYCSSSGCICYSPYIGSDCMSKIITVAPPKKNYTDPNVEISVGASSNDNSATDSNEQSTEVVLFKTLISLVSLRELNIYNKEVYKHTFSEWIYTELDDLTGKYFTNISVPNPSTGENFMVNVTTTLKWFNETTTVKFANQDLVMNPSTVKYSVEFSPYPFSSQLNQLQLVLSASLEASTSSDICSTKEFGDTSSGDDSNYLLIQVDDHSVYGRFIKRGILDNYVVSVSNVLLDSEMNVAESSNNPQSYIGISIPYYTTSAAIDPDFSVLLDSSPATESTQNSVCSSTITKKSGLSTTQLVGIIIGCVAFALIAIISVTYYIVKKRKNAKFLKSFSAKLKNQNPIN